MRSRFVLFAALALTSACRAADDEHQVLMKHIESAVRLPEDAWAIEEYARNYASMPDGTVLAIYVKPFEHVAYPDQACEQVLENLETAPCSTETIAELEAQDAQLAESRGKAGESRWLNDYRKLPTMNDGGCMLIEISFDPRSRKIERVECNGTA